jgi:mono/diheme cytochrome c family protein
MCTGCHMKPGMRASEISTGLYPRPPNLAMGESGGAHRDARSSASRQFWIIKHGIMASGMAAFGLTHDDARIWAMVAFLQKQPKMSVSEYRALTANAGAMEGMEGHAPSGMSMPPAPASTAPVPSPATSAAAPAASSTP